MKKKKTKRMSVSVDPKLPAAERKRLSAFIQGLKRERPTMFNEPFSFIYLGSTVVVKS